MRTSTNVYLKVPKSKNKITTIAHNSTTPLTTHPNI